MSAPDWTKAAEFVPSWYVKKDTAAAAPAATPAPAPAPKPAAKPAGGKKAPAASNDQSSGTRIVAPAAGATATAPAATTGNGASSSVAAPATSTDSAATAPSKHLNANAVAFVMPTKAAAAPPQYPADTAAKQANARNQAASSQPQQQQQQQQQHAAGGNKRGNNNKNGDASSSAPSAPAATAGTSTGKHQHHQQQAAAAAASASSSAPAAAAPGKGRQNPKPKKPPTPPVAQKSHVSPTMGAQSGSWVTPPLAGAPGPKGGAGSPPPLPSMDLGAPAVVDAAALITTAVEKLGVKHTQREVERIISTSKMSSSAAAFTPAGFVPKTRPTVVPVSVPKNTAVAGVVVPEESRNDMSTLDTWCLFFDDAVKKSSEEFDPYLICHMSDVPTFWRVLQNVPPVSRQNDGTNYYLFREGVMPKWEDPRNDGGGAWTLKFQLTRSSEIIDATWERMACQVVGENWSEDIRPTVQGIVAKIRPRSITFQIWVSRRNNELLVQLKDRALAHTLAATMWDYVPHPRKDGAAPAAASSSSSGIGGGGGGAGTAAAAGAPPAASSSTASPSGAGSSAASRESSQPKS